MRTVSWCQVRVAVILAAMSTAFPACVKSKVTVYVNPDGSGHIVVSRLYDRELVASLESARSREQDSYMGNAPNYPMQMHLSTDVTDDEAKPAKTRDPFFDEKALRRDAKSYGSSVKFVKARRLDVDGCRGSITVYSFKDINDVFIAPDLSRLYLAVQRGGMDPFAREEGEDEDDGGGRRGGQGIEFSFQTGSVSRLKILLPTGHGDVEREDGENEDGNDDGDEEKSPEEKDAAEWLQRDRGWGWSSGGDSRVLSLGLDVVLNGEIASSNASHTNASARNRIVLLDLDTTRRDAKKERSPANDDLFGSYDFRRVIKGIMKEPGTIVETNREVVVEFR